MKHHMYEVIDIEMRHKYICSVITFLWFKKPFLFRSRLSKELTREEMRNINKSEYIRVADCFLVEKTKFTNDVVWYKKRITTL